MINLGKTTDRPYIPIVASDNDGTGSSLFTRVNLVSGFNPFLIEKCLMSTLIFEDQTSDEVSPCRWRLAADRRADRPRPHRHKLRA